MIQLALELPNNTFSALRLSPAEFVREMRIAAAVQWYAEKRISQEKAAEIAGQSRVEFIDECVPFLLTRKPHTCLCHQH